MLASLIRTIVPLIVGWLLAIPVVASTGVTKALLTTAVSAGVTAAYYLAVRLLEKYVTPKFGWLLGLAKQPAYAKKPATGGIVTPGGTYLVGERGPETVVPSNVQVFPPAGA